MARNTRLKSASPPAPHRIALCGVLDTAAAAAIHKEARLAAETGNALGCVVDCRDAEFLGTAALQILFALKVDLEKRGATLRFDGLSAPQQQWLQIAGLDKVLSSSPDNQ